MTTATTKLPKDLTTGDKVQFNGEVGTVVSNRPAPVLPHDKYDTQSRSVEFALAGKQNLHVRLKGGDAMRIAN